MMKNKPCNDGCKITEDGFAEVCEKHYSEYMDYPMDTGLITDEKGGWRIFKKLGVYPK